MLMRALQIPFYYRSGIKNLLSRKIERIPSDYSLIFPIGTRDMEPHGSVIEIGQFVRQRRKAAKLTQRQLAEIAGVGQRFISELERGKPTLRLAQVDCVLAVFGKELGVVERKPEAIDESQ